VIHATFFKLEGGDCNSDTTLLRSKFRVIEHLKGKRMENMM